MTSTNSNSPRLATPRSHGLRDLALVAFLVVVLGAFVAQISSPPKAAHAAAVSASVPASVGAPSRSA